MRTDEENDNKFATYGFVMFLTGCIIVFLLLFVGKVAVRFEALEQAISELEK